MQVLMVMTDTMGAGDETAAAALLDEIGGGGTSDEEAWMVALTTLEMVTVKVTEDVEVETGAIEVETGATTLETG